MILSHQKVKFDRLYDQLIGLENSDTITLTGKRVCEDLISQTPASGEILYLDPCCGKGTILYYLYIKLWETIQIDDVENKNRCIMGCLYGCDINERQLDIARALLKKGQRIMGVKNVMEPNLKTFDTLSGENPFPNKKFTVVITNPPYNGERTKGDSAKNKSEDIYPLFVERAYELSSRYVIMITKSSWMFLTNKEKFMEKMLKTFNVSKIHHYRENPFDGTDIEGGVSYFVIDKANAEKTFSLNGMSFDRSKDYNFLPYSLSKEEISVLKKLESLPKMSMQNFRSQNFYDIASKDDRLSDSPTNEDDVVVHVSLVKGGIKYISRSYLNEKANKDLFKCKIFTPAAYSVPNKLGRMVMSSENELCSKSMHGWVFDSQVDMVAFHSYTQTKVFKFAVSLLKNTQNIQLKTFSLIPHIDYSSMKTIDDVSVYDHLGFNEEEIAVIEKRCSCLKLV
jgi:hypothetical protein